jgi:hypothetical protein
MQYEDKSTSGFSRRKAQKAIASHYPRSNPPISLDSSILTALRQGQQTVIRTPITVVCGATEPIPRDDPGCCCLDPITITAAIRSDLPPPTSFTGIGNDYCTISYDISWTGGQGGSVSVIASGDAVYEQLWIPEPPTSGVLWINFIGTCNVAAFADVTVHESNCSATINVQSCFLAGSLVTLVDGSTKPIEEIRVGDIVVGAEGEHNEVLALHRPLLGSSRMCRINREHSTTSHHPHVSVDRKFYCVHPATVENSTYGHEHNVIDADGVSVKRLLHGLRKGRAQELTTGVELKTIEGGRLVKDLEIYDMPPETQLYNLVVGGSHTYHVDGYAVTGWPREDDFDYDAWVPK